MNILISTFGVRGDVQPYLVLAVGLQGAGHRVTLVFPRMAAVVHHGGAGTTGAGLRAGAPTIITPFAPNDQPAWAERVAALGVGLRLPGIRQLTAEKLAEAIHGVVTDSALRGRAAALGEKIRAEDGVARAIEVIERYAAEFSRRPGARA